MPKLIVFPGSAQQFEIDLASRPQVRLGRSGDNDVVVPRRMASRKHARIESRDGRYFIHDQESYNGTFVNNHSVREAELLHGDEIRIASCVLRFVDEQAAAVADPEMQRRMEADTPTGFQRQAADPASTRLEEEAETGALRTGVLTVADIQSALDAALQKGLTPSPVAHPGSAGRPAPGPGPRSRTSPR